MPQWTAAGPVGFIGRKHVVKGLFWAQSWFAVQSHVKARAHHYSLDLTLVVGVVTEGPGSKENKVLGIKKTSKRPLESCTSSSPHPPPLLMLWLLFHYKHCLSHVALGEHLHRNNRGRNQNSRGLIKGCTNKRRRGIKTAQRRRDEGQNLTESSRAKDRRV